MCAMPQSSRVIVTLRACCSQRLTSPSCADDCDANAKTVSSASTSFFIESLRRLAFIINNKTTRLASREKLIDSDRPASRFVLTLMLDRRLDNVIQTREILFQIFVTPGE